MNLLPDIETYFETVDEYRYSITVSLFVLCGTIYLFPATIGLSGVIGTTSYAIGITTLLSMFSVSVAIIIVRDFWPWLKDRLMG